MKCHLLFLSAAGLTLSLAGSLAEAGPRLSGDMCRPLTDQNRARCCSADNWMEILQPWERGECMSRDRNASRMAGPVRQATAKPDRGGRGGPDPGEGGGDNGGGDNGGGDNGGGDDGGCQGRGGGNCGVGLGGGGGNGTGNEGNGQGPGDNGNGNGPPSGNPGGQGGNSGHGNNH